RQLSVEVSDLEVIVAALTILPGDGSRFGDDSRAGVGVLTGYGKTRRSDESVGDAIVIGIFNGWRLRWRNRALGILVRIWILIAIAQVCRDLTRLVPIGPVKRCA